MVVLDMKIHLHIDSHRHGRLRRGLLGKGHEPIAMCSSNNTRLIPEEL